LGYKGVFLDKRDGVYFATIQINNKRKYLDRFKTSLEAAKAYNKACTKLHGTFSRLNTL
jgi:hypothetical protein